MGRTLMLIAGVVAFLSETQSASAFSTRQVDPVTANNRLADPDGGSTFGIPGGHMTLQFTGPQSGVSSSSPFVTSPGTAFVPSEHR